MKERVYRYLRSIPYGRVVTYGQIARYLGNPRLARAVGNVLHQNPDGNKTPCYKVVNAQGHLSESYAFGGMEAQRERLLAEGIAVEHNRVDLNIYGMKTIEERADMASYLIVVDMQKDFVDGPLGTPEAVAILPRVREKIAAAKAAGVRVIFTRDTHGENYLSTNEGAHLPVAHCIYGSEGWQIDATLDTAGAVIIDKPSFGYLNWRDYIEDAAELSIELIGVCTDICVVSNALILKATFPEARVSVDASACAGVTPATHEAALTTMKMCQIEVAEAK